MSRKVRIEIDPDAEEEIIIRTHTLTPEIRELEKALSDNRTQSGEIALQMGDAEYIIPYREILFFEVRGSKVSAHTADWMYYTDEKLYELERKLPFYFMRISKSTILNLRAVNAIKRDVAGIGQVFFSNTDKSVYVSRLYYKPFKEKLYEIRLH